MTAGRIRFWAQPAVVLLIVWLKLPSGDVVRTGLPLTSTVSTSVVVRS